LALALDPRPPGSAKLGGTAFWRVGVGDLRLVYHVDDRRRLVVVLRVAKRAERTYRGL
jgi:mRNA interferase RelE/StbE